MKRIATSISLLATLFFSLNPTGALAGLTAEDKKSVLYTTEFYSIVDGVQCSSSDINLEGADNTQKGFNYYVSKGLTPMLSAAFIGNFLQESGMNPKSVQPGGAGRGIAQWGTGGRWDTSTLNVLTFANDQGKSQWDLSLQLDFSWKELTGSYSSVLNRAKNASSIEAAVNIISTDYEMAGTPYMSNRIAYAKKVLAKDGGGATGGGTTGDVCSNAGGIGSSGDFTFPEKTTQAAIKAMNPAWCYTSQTSCHHDYFAADIFNRIGTTNVVAVEGDIVKADDVSCHGGYDVPRVQMLGKDKIYYYYTHMKPGSIRVHAGQHVTPGTALGEIGPTECAENTNPHLHFQMSSVEINNTEDPNERSKYIDPQPNLIQAFKNLPAN